MIYTVGQTTAELEALVADPYSPQWDLDEATADLAARRRTADEEEADVEGDRYESDWWRRGE